MQSMNSFPCPITLLSVTYWAKYVYLSWPSGWYLLTFIKPCPLLHTLPHYFIRLSQQAKRAGAISVLFYKEESRMLENSKSLPIATQLRTDRPTFVPGGLNTQPVFFTPVIKTVKHCTYVYQSLGWRLTEWFFPLVGVSFVADLLKRNSWSFCFTSVLATAPETHTYGNRWDVEFHPSCF